MSRQDSNGHAMPGGCQGFLHLPTVGKLDGGSVSFVAVNAMVDPGHKYRVGHRQ